MGADWRTRLSLTSVAGLMALALLPATAMAATTSIVSVSSNEDPGDSDSVLGIDISKTGRFVAFSSLAHNFGGDDANNDYDVFVRDRELGVTDRVSASIDSNDPGGESANPAISASGRFVAFESSAADLVAGDGNGKTDIFLTDRDSGVVRLVSVSSSETQATGFNSNNPDISASGRFVVFESAAAGLVGSDTNDVADIFIRDRTNGTTRRVSLTARGRQGNGPSQVPSISADGRFVAFQSDASNLVRRDTNGETDVFVRDRQNGTTRRVSVSSSGRQGNGGSYEPAISADGRYVAFYSYATNFARNSVVDRYQVFLHDRVTGTTRRASVSSRGRPANDDSYPQDVSADGRFVVFASDATNLTRGEEADSEVYLRDMKLGKTRKVSVGLNGEVADGGSSTPVISSNGRFAAFVSGASNLTPEADASGWDVFARGPLR